MRESTIEEFGVAMFKAQGDLPYKFTSPGRRNVPDRLRLRAIPPEHQAIVAQYVQFIEFKATGEKPTAAQEREHARLRKLGFRVVVVDSMAGVDALVSGAAPAAPGVCAVEESPAAGDAQVLAALKQAHMALIGFMPQHRNSVIVSAIVAAREAIDAAEAAQRKGDA